MTTTKKTTLLRTFHALCGKKGMKPYEKEALLDGYGVASSADLSERQLRDLIAKLQGDSEGDRWRKRVIASVGKWLELTGGKNNLDAVKGIACRATGYDDFNKIPVPRLQNVYYGFVKKQRDELAIQALPKAKELEKLDRHERERRVRELEAAMRRAVESEEYEAAAKLRDEIKTLNNETP